MSEDADLYAGYALIVLDENTEEQDYVVSTDYATLIFLRDMNRAGGRSASVRFVDDGAVWDFLAAHVADDAASFLAAQAGL